MSMLRERLEEAKELLCRLDQLKESL